MQTGQTEIALYWTAWSGHPIFDCGLKVIRFPNLPQ